MRALVMDVRRVEQRDERFSDGQWKKLSEGTSVGRKKIDCFHSTQVYRQSPLWDEYVAKDCFARDAEGKLLVAGIQMKGEEIYNRDKENLPGFLGMFCRTTLPWYYLSRLARVRYENNALYYSEGVVARTEEGRNIIRKGEFVLRENDNLFVPALWQKKEIIACSKNGYENKAWRMAETAGQLLWRILCDTYHTETVVSEWKSLYERVEE